MRLWMDFVFHCLLHMLTVQYLTLHFSTLLFIYFFYQWIGLFSVPHSVLALDLIYLENTVYSRFVTFLLTLSILCTLKCNKVMQIQPSASLQRCCTLTFHLNLCLLSLSHF